MTQENSWKIFPKYMILNKNPINPLSDHPIFGNIFQDLAIWVNKLDFHLATKNLETIIVGVMNTNV